MVQNMLAAVFLILSLFSFGCGPGDPIDIDYGETLQSVTNGTQTNGYPSVGLFRTTGAMCSATLIGSRAVLTARHCIKSASGTFDIGGTTKTWNRAYKHNTSDIAVAILTSSSSVTPSPIRTTVPSVGTRLTIVGYGYSSTSGSGGVGRKFVGYNNISSINSSELRFRTGGSASAICHGDSGGPSFVSSAVAGVHSWGSGNNQYCASYESGDMRVDVVSAWIRQVAGGGGGDDCEDTPGYVDAQGYRCSDWVGYNCDRAVEEWGYTSVQEASIKANCKLSCDLCDGGGNVCQDTPGYTDAQGYSCADWVGYDCARAVEDWDYTPDQEASIKANCKLSCRLCRGGEGVCQDIEGFTDAQGYSCVDWVEADCTRAVEDWGYTSDQQEEILQNCEQSCGLCPLIFPSA